jgi:phage repressor protein C with HTH and peptisase S24 domain
MRIEGDSMAPEYRPGDYVMVDTSHTRPGDGDFVLGKPYGIPMVKQVRIVHGANPRKLRVISVNPIYEPYEVSPEDIDIIGRVVGKWVWK